MNVLFRPSFQRALAALDEETKATVISTAKKLPEVFGRPHQHSGIGVRRIGPFFEFRIGLKLRVLFTIQRGDAVLLTLGNHDDIVRYLKDNR